MRFELVDAAEGYSDTNAPTSQRGRRSGACHQPKGRRGRKDPAGLVWFAR